MLKAQDARVALAGLRPATEASMELENVLGSGETRGLDAAEATFALSQVIELGGKRNFRTAAAQAGRNVLSVEQQAVQLDVLAEVTRRFILRCLVSTAPCLDSPCLRIAGAAALVLAASGTHGDGVNECSGSRRAPWHRLWQCVYPNAHDHEQCAGVVPDA